MSDYLAEVRDLAQMLVADAIPHDSRQPGRLDRATWRRLEDAGLTGLAVDERYGGSGGDLLLAAEVVGAGAMLASPLAETLLLAGPLIQVARATLPIGPLTVAFADLRSDGEDRSGRVVRVPWLRDADHLLIVSPDEGKARLDIVTCDDPGIVVTPGANVAGEPRDDAVLTKVRPISSHVLPEESLERSRQHGALMRCVQSVAVAESVLSVTLEYLRQRRQFGRPLISFQVLQHGLAQLTAQVAMTVLATRAALCSVVTEDRAWFRVAAAKLETSMLAGPIASFSHQAHGAIGFTEEYRLGAATSRLWAWRDEFGGERDWQRYLASRWQEPDPVEFWPLLTDT